MVICRATAKAVSGLKKISFCFLCVCKLKRERERERAVSLSSRLFYLTLGIAYSGGSFLNQVLKYILSKNTPENKRILSLDFACFGSGRSSEYSS